MQPDPFWHGDCWSCCSGRILPGQGIEDRIEPDHTGDPLQVAVSDLSEGIIPEKVRKLQGKCCGKPVNGIG